MQTGDLFAKEIKKLQGIRLESRLGKRTIKKFKKSPLHRRGPDENHAKGV